MIFAGSSPNLTCTVMLNPHVNVEVTMKTEWSGPSRSTLTSTDPTLMENFTQYTNIIPLKLVTLSDAGEYHCSATVSSNSTYVMNSETVTGSQNITISKTILLCDIFT